MNRIGMRRNIASSMLKLRLNVYEVSPTIPRPNDKYRDAEISKAISEWKAQHISVNYHS
ncbi:hypothetical protein [Paenibacillus sp. GP183]|uniref:hypothetical protein n=1 Tax=Paenibacillus sp. GP183 TaxID=1882751 RepID=UPI000899F699|nr:hypothetical protein [Paenibacillus sp. GP183]SEC41179.1 hypothetical protein SAMN05443246_4014 [Paenibacillus sp. GP183]